MIIQIRKDDGSVVEVPRGSFVEIRHPDETEIQAVFFSSEPGRVTHVVPGSAEAANYERLMQGHVKMSKPAKR